jgi:hypothetical protein
MRRSPRRSRNSDIGHLGVDHFELRHLQLGRWHVGASCPAFMAAGSMASMSRYRSRRATTAISTFEGGCALKRRADRTRRSIEDELLEVVAAAVPVADELSEDLAEATADATIITAVWMDA